LKEPFRLDFHYLYTAWIVSFNFLSSPASHRVFVFAYDAWLQIVFGRNEWRLC